MRIILGLTAACLLAIPGECTALFNNGTPDQTQTGGELDCSPCSGRTNYVYDNFTVGAGGWTVTGLFGSYELFGTATPLPTTGYWEIRTGISAGNSGTLVAGGSGAITTNAISNPPGGSNSYTYFQANIATTATFLSQGTYWMVLAPYGGVNESFVMQTFGAGGVAAVTDGLSFMQGTIFPTMTNIGTYLQPFTGHSSYDWSYGVTGVANTPEPATWVLAGCGLLAIARQRSGRS